ncbi:MAG: hypothetical protein M3O36_00625 [Myxococcota bacterium]|nr:hypothetical protein [Myxococcota bacterium]
MRSLSIFVRVTARAHFLAHVLACLACLACLAELGCNRPPAAAPEASQSPPPPSSSSVAAPASSSDAAPSGARQRPSKANLPTGCADPSAGLCTPPGGFVDRLCAKPHQDVALALFSKATPFTRLYLRGKVDELAFEEEVLALRMHVPSKNGMVVGSAAGTYDVLRWDGTCSMGIEAEMITRTRPPRPVPAHVQWHRIAPGNQDALIAGSAALKQAHARRGKECKGAMSGDVSSACQRADAALVDAIVAYVREGGNVPEALLPE